MNKPIMEYNGNGILAILCGFVSAFFNNIFSIDPLFIQDIKQDAFKAVVVGFLGAVAGLASKDVYGFVKKDGWSYVKKAGAACMRHFVAWRNKCKP